MNVARRKHGDDRRKDFAEQYHELSQCIENGVGSKARVVAAVIGTYSSRLSNHLEDLSNTKLGKRWFSKSRLGKARFSCPPT